MTDRMHRRRRRGQALVEFALVLPILLLMIFGIVDAGRLIYTYNTVSNAARDGARVAIVNQSNFGTDTCDTTSTTAWPIGCAVTSGLELGLTAADVSVSYRDATDSVACSDPNNPGQLLIGCLAVVTATGDFTPITPVIGQIIGQVSLSSTTKIPVERVCSNPPPSPLASC
jgi:Flp pilus assembly protein TadG